MTAQAQSPTNPSSHADELTAALRVLHKLAPQMVASAAAASGVVAAPAATGAPVAADLPANSGGSTDTRVQALRNHVHALSEELVATQAKVASLHTRVTSFLATAVQSGVSSSATEAELRALKSENSALVASLTASRDRQTLLLTMAASDASGVAAGGGATSGSALEAGGVPSNSRLALIPPAYSGGGGSGGSGGGSHHRSSHRHRSHHHHHSTASRAQ